MTTSEQITPPSPASNPNFALGVPSPNQIEVSLFGPGYGESIVFHLPGGYWVVVDSCVRPNSKRSAPLEYLELLGVDMATRVALIVASHWHDDHVRGLAELVSQCRSASFACANALCQNEFLTLVARHQQQRTIEMGSGVSEMAATFDMLRGRQPMFVGPDRMILNVDGSSIAPNLRSTVTTLSPSDKQFQIFISEIASLIPATRATKYRAVALRPNHVAMALWVNVGEDCSILLGSDLEDVGTDVNLGWNAILRSTTRPQGRASVFKVAHHGSRTGHNDSVWSSMLQGNPISILTPFVRGRVALPTPGDATRIMNFSSHAHSTARVRQPVGRDRMMWRKPFARPLEGASDRSNSGLATFGCAKLLAREMTGRTNTVATRAPYRRSTTFEKVSFAILAARYNFQFATSHRNSALKMTIRNVKAQEK